MFIAEIILTLPHHWPTRITTRCQFSERKTQCDEIILQTNQLTACNETDEICAIFCANSFAWYWSDSFLLFANLLKSAACTQSIVHFVLVEWITMKLTRQLCQRYKIKCSCMRRLSVSEFSAWLHSNGANYYYFQIVFLQLEPHWTSYEHRCGLRRFLSPLSSGEKNQFVFF